MWSDVCLEGIAQAAMQRVGWGPSWWPAEQLTPLASVQAHTSLILCLQHYLFCGLWPLFWTTR